MQVNQAEVEEQRGTLENFASSLEKKEKEMAELQRKVATSDVAAVAIVGSVVAPH